MKSEKTAKMFFKTFYWLRTFSKFNILMACFLNDHSQNAFFATIMDQNELHSSSVFLISWLGSNSLFWTPLELSEGVVKVQSWYQLSGSCPSELQWPWVFQTWDCLGLMFKVIQQGSEDCRLQPVLIFQTNSDYIYINYSILNRGNVFGWRWQRPSSSQVKDRLRQRERVP